MRSRALLLGLLCTLPAFADYSDSPKTPQLLASLARDHGFSPAQLDQVRTALADARPLPQLISSEQNNKERTLSWDAYAALHITAANIDRGRGFMHEQRAWLARAESEYGVPPEVVAALLGVETKFGSYTGRYRVLDALATQGYDHPTRSSFFFEQLIQYFVLCRDAGFEPQGLRGSYAGAMGDAQFMPGNYRRLAVDFDGDGRRDLWTAADAIGSIGNYLLRYDASRAWRRGEPLMVPARIAGSLPADFPRNGKRADSTIGALRRAGIEATDALPAPLPAGLIELARNDGPEWWIALPNFYSIESYNPRVFYAMAVAQLARQLANAEPQK